MISSNSILLKIDDVNSTVPNHATVCHLPFAALQEAFRCPGHTEGSSSLPLILEKIVIAIVCASSFCVFLHAWHAFEPVDDEPADHKLSETSTQLVPYTGTIRGPSEVPLKCRVLLSPQLPQMVSPAIPVVGIGIPEEVPSKLNNQRAKPRRNYALQPPRKGPQQLQCDVYTMVVQASMICEQRQRTRRRKMYQCPANKLAIKSCSAIQAMMQEDRWWVNLYPIIYPNESKRDKTKKAEKIERIKKGEKLRCTCHGNELRVAIASARPEFVLYVLGTGLYDVNERNRRGSSPLSDAAAIGSAEIVEILISYGARVNISKDMLSPNEPVNPFEEACTNGHHRVVELLLRHKVYVHEVPGCLRKACYYGKVAVVAVLLRWRREGTQYHRHALPLNQCVESVRRGHFVRGDLTDYNVCDFLAHWKEDEFDGTYLESDPYGTYWDEYKRVVVIIELLIEAGVKHNEECDCGRDDWVRGHHILRWNHRRENSDQWRRALAGIRAETDDTDRKDFLDKSKVDTTSWWSNQECNCQYCALKAKERRLFFHYAVTRSNVVPGLCTVDEFDTEAGEISDDSLLGETEAERVAQNRAL